MEMESFDPLPLEDDSNRAHVAVRKRTIGGEYIPRTYITTETIVGLKL